MVSLLLLRSVGHRDDFCCVPLKRSQFLHSQRNQMNEFGEFSGIFFWGPQWGRGQAPPCSFHSTLILPPRGLLYTLRRCFSTVLPKNLPKAGKAQINRLCSTLCISFSSVQFSHSIVSDSLRPHEPQHTRPPCPSPTPRVHSNHVHWVSDAIHHLILCHPLLLLPSIFPSIRIFSNESVLHIRWPKYCSFGFNISPSNEHPGLISFSMDWLALLAVQGTLKSFLQHHSSKSSVLSFLHRPTLNIHTWPLEKL